MYGSTMYLLQFDGMLQPLTEQPQMGGFLGYGWLMSRDGSEVAHGFGLFANKQTVNSNIAEYLALIKALEASVDLREQSNTSLTYPVRFHRHKPAL
jgi:ribonuclease HI